ncbi:hypothetical protein AVEN_53742-1 [Araneus ventricosus]|uniref:Uncharacterized protein n=1 Tax=Araneus ventricosus TaxID=182803 RepID=A0A4Y2UGJ6_ARAVE|nr:hypothetical protein AVEN_53742-1 [Araneus ventricosus]
MCPFLNTKSTVKSPPRKYSLFSIPQDQQSKKAPENIILSQYKISGQKKPQEMFSFSQISSQKPQEKIFSFLLHYKINRPKALKLFLNTRSAIQKTENIAAFLNTRSTVKNPKKIFSFPSMQDQPSQKLPENITPFSQYRIHQSKKPQKIFSFSQYKVSSQKLKNILHFLNTRSLVKNENILLFSIPQDQQSKSSKKIFSFSQYKISHFKSLFSQYKIQQAKALENILLFSIQDQQSKAQKIFTTIIQDQLVKSPKKIFSFPQYKISSQKAPRKYSPFLNTRSMFKAPENILLFSIQGQQSEN